MRKINIFMKVSKIVNCEHYTLQHRYNYIILYFSGAQGEYAGLRAIMAYLHAIDQTQRKVLFLTCTIFQYIQVIKRTNVANFSKLLKS